MKKKTQPKYSMPVGYLNYEQTRELCHEFAHSLTDVVNTEFARSKTGKQLMYEACQKEIITEVLSKYDLDSFQSATLLLQIGIEMLRIHDHMTGEQDGDI